jgi:hypothetical protein
MLVGRPPFRGQSEYLTFQLILNRQFEYPNFVSDTARDLIDLLLVTRNLLPTFFCSILFFHIFPLISET